MTIVRTLHQIACAIRSSEQSEQKHAPLYRHEPQNARRSSEQSGQEHSPPLKDFRIPIPPSRPLPPISKPKSPSLLPPRLSFTKDLAPQSPMSSNATEPPQSPRSFLSSPVARPSSFPQSSFPQSSFPQSSFPQSSFPQSSFPQSSFPQSSFPQSSYPQGAFPRSSFPYPPSKRRDDDIRPGFSSSTFQQQLGGEFTNAVRGLLDENPNLVYQATSNLLAASLEIPKGPFNFLNAGSGMGAQRDLSIFSTCKDNIQALISGFQWLFRVHGTSVACRTIFALLVRTGQPPQKTRTRFFQTGVQLKMDMYNNLASASLASIHWAAYKYNPSWLTHTRTAIFRIGLPALGLATAVIFLLIVVFNVSTLGTTAIVLTTTAAVSSVTFIGYEAIKAYASSQKFARHILPTLPRSEVDAIMALLPASHKWCGPTLGDYYRYHIADMLAATWWEGCLDDRIPIESLPDAQLINVSLIRAIWEVIKADIGFVEAQNLLQTANRMHSSMGMRSKNQIIRLFHGVIRKNR